MGGLILVVVGESEVVDVGREGAEAALEGERDVSATQSAVVGDVVDLQVRVEVSLPVAHVSLNLDGSLGDEILAVVVGVGIVDGVSMVVVQRGDDGHAPPYRQHMKQHEHGADGEDHVGDGPQRRRIQEIGGPEHRREDDGGEPHAAGVLHREVVGVGEVIVARLLHPLPHLPHGEDGVDHHDHADDHDDIAPQADGTLGHEAVGHPGVQHQWRHREAGDDGTDPRDRLPLAPLTERAEEAEQQRGAVEIVAGGEVRLVHEPGRGVGGFDGVGQQEGGHHVDDALQLAVGPDGGTVLLRLLARVEPAHGGKRPAQCDIDRRRHSVVIVFVHGCKDIKKSRNGSNFMDIFLKARSVCGSPSDQRA